MSVHLEVAPGYEELVRGLGLDDPRCAPAFDRGEVISTSHDTRVLRFRAQEAGPLFYFKVYRYHELRRLFTFTYRRSRTRTEYEALQYLRANGLPGIEPVAYGSHRVLRVIRSCFLITRAVDGSRDLDHALPDWERGGPERARALNPCADLVRRMHDVNFFAYDLKFRNMLVTERDDPPSFHLLDHPKARVIASSRPRARRAALVFDLATLDKDAPDWLSRTERLRWFLRYRGHDRLDDEDRELLRDIEARRQRLLGKRARHHRRRKGRPGIQRTWP